MSTPTEPTATVTLTAYQAQILVNALGDGVTLRSHGDEKCGWNTRHCKPGRRCDDCKQDSEEVAIYEAMAPQFVAIARMAA